MTAILARHQARCGGNKTNHDEKDSGERDVRKTIYAVKMTKVKQAMITNRHIIHKIQCTDFD